MAKKVHATDSLLGLIAPSRLRQVSKGELIFTPEEGDDTCYVIESGLVKAVSGTRQGEEVRIIYGPSELFPVAWIMGKPVYNIQFYALADCVLAELSQSALRTAALANPKLAWALLQKISEQFAVYNARADNLRYKYSRERLAYRLLLLAYRFGEIAPDKAVILPALSQQDIASTIHATRESVNRELRRFERLKLIEHRQGKIALLDRDRLRKELGNDLDKLYFDE